MDNWYRSTGNTGWYSQTHGGGIYMQDTTWIWTYGTKKFHVNNTGSDAVLVSGGVTAGTFTETSARKYKENIAPLTDSLAAIQKMYPVTYTLKDQEDPEVQIGLIADDVEEFRPEYVMKQDGEVEGIHYQRIVADLIGAVKEQQGQIEDLNKRIVELEESK